MPPPFVGVILNDESLHIVLLIVSIFGLGFTYTFKLNGKPEQLSPIPALGIML